MTVHHRIDLTTLAATEVDYFFAEVREILAQELAGGEPDQALDADADFELYLRHVGHQPGEHVTWDFSIDIEAYDFDYRIENAEALATSIMNRSNKAFTQRFGARLRIAVWLKLLTAAWVQSGP